MDFKTGKKIANKTMGSKKWLKMLAGIKSL